MLPLERLTKKTMKPSPLKNERPHDLTPDVSLLREAQKSVLRRLESGIERLNKDKKVICFLGLPGAGKTTQIQELKSATGAPVFHMGKFAKETGQRDESRRAKGELLEGLDEQFLERVAESSHSYLILDGFPRSPQQSQLLLEMATQKGWDVEVVHLAFSKNEEEETSFRRQVDRAEAGGEQLDEERFRGKIRRALNMDMAALASLQEKGGKVLELDATRPQSEITKEIRESMGLDLESLPWEHDSLMVVEQVSKQLGIEMWLCAGSLYRAFWNGKFGPMQESTDKDLFIEREEDIESVEAALEAAAPQVRWAVHSRVKESVDHYGLNPDSLQQGILDVPLNFRQGAVRMKEGKIDVLMGEGIEAELRQGIVRFDEAILAQLPPNVLEKTLAEAPSRIRKTMEEYPGLKLEGRLSELYEAKYGKHTSQEIKRDWNDIESAVIEREYGGRSRWSAEHWNSREFEVAAGIVDFYRTAQRIPSTPPRPEKAHLPGSLEALRLIRSKAQKGRPVTAEEQGLLKEGVSAPEGYESWLHYTLTESPDDQFKEWLLNQIRSRTPLGGKEGYLERIWDMAKTEKKGGQKETHMAFPLHKHLQEAALQLSTDALASELEVAGLSPAEIKKIRRCARLAMLWHDMGKVHNVYTPGSHEAIGAKQWERNKPDWISDEEAQIVSWMIRTHDISGRLLRGITEKPDSKITDAHFNPTSEPSYKGALDPSAVREELLKSGFDLPVATALHLAVWKADVSSVSALRWLLPVVEQVRQLVLSRS